MDAGWCFTFGETLVAHVAFSDDSAFFRILRDVVGTFENAVGAADALVVKVADDAGVRVFFVSADGAAIHASRILAVVAGGGDSLLPAGSDQNSGVAPSFLVIETVERVAGGNTGFAAGAAV